MASGYFESPAPWNKQYTYRTEWSSVPSVATNSSTVTFNHYIVCPYGLQIGSNPNCYSMIDGDVNSRKYFTSPAINVGGGTKPLLGTTTHVIAHNSDGTKSFRYDGYINSPYMQYPKNGGTVVLDRIPRASTFTISKSQVQMNGSDSVTVTITRADPLFRHYIVIKLKDRYIDFSTGETTQTFTIPTAWCDQVVTETAMTGTITVDTYSEGVRIGTSTQNIVFVVPSNIIPTIQNFTATRIDGDVPEDWGLYVQSKSKVKLDIVGAEGVYGSTITSYHITGDTVNSNTSSATSNFLTKSGTSTFIATVTDSRGRTATKTVSITVQPYAKPSFLTKSAYRSNSAGLWDPTSGTAARVLVNTSYSTVGNKNAIIVKASYKSETASAYTGTTTISNNTATTLWNGLLLIEIDYTIKFEVTDQFEKIETTVPFPSARRLMNFRNDINGIAMGGFSDLPNTVEIKSGMDLLVSGKLKGVYETISVSEFKDVTTTMTTVLSVEIPSNCTFFLTGTLMYNRSQPSAVGLSESNLLLNGAAIAESVGIGYQKLTHTICGNTGISGENIYLWAKCVANGKNTVAIEGFYIKSV